MIAARNFRIEERPDAVRASCDIAGDGFDTSLHFDVHPSNADAIDIDEPNWAAVALIYPAMLMGRDLVIEADLSPYLLTNLRHDFMALVHNFEPLAKPVRIEAGTTSAPAYRHGGKDVATGLSFGVDSFATLLRYTRPEVPKGVRLTAAAIYQVGAFARTSDLSIRLDRVRKRCEDIVTPMGMSVYSLSANMDDVFTPAAAFGPVDFGKTVGFRNGAAAMVLQKRLGTYLPSGNVGYSQATFGPSASTEPLDGVLQPLLSTEGLLFQAALAGTGRYNKLLEIVDNPLVSQNLDVCVAPARSRFIGGAARNNCSKCWKCGQTMLALESMGKLDAFGAVFDLDLYRQNRNRILKVVVNRYHGTGQPGPLNEDVEKAIQSGLFVPQPDVPRPDIPNYPNPQPVVVPPASPQPDAATPDVAKPDTRPAPTEMTWSLRLRKKAWRLRRKVYAFAGIKR